MFIYHDVHGAPNRKCNKIYKRVNFFKQAVREAATICSRPLQVDLLTVKVAPESRVTWASSVPILVFLGLSVLDLGPMHATDS